MKKFIEFLKEEEQEPVDVSGWKRVGDQLGSNPGGRFQNKAGNHYYVKFSKSDNHARNEFLAHHLYKQAGAPVMDHYLVKHPKGLGTATQWQDVQPFDENNEGHIKDIKKHFATHCLAANWDAIGLVNDNQVVTKKGMATVDVGGSLLYRAQGGPKGEAFGHKCDEWDTLRKYNKSTFGRMTPEEMIDSTRHMASNLRPHHIVQLTHLHGPGDHSEKVELAAKLINRRKDLIQKANALADKHGLTPVEEPHEDHTPPEKP